MRDFKWGFSTLGCPECSLGEAVALADEYDFRMLELRSVDGSIDLPKVFEEPEKRALLKRLAGEGRIRVFGSSFGISSRRNNYEELAALGRLADEAGFRICGCSADSILPRNSIPKSSRSRSKTSPGSAGRT